MKIGLTGVPGSGKTLLAETIKTAIEMKDLSDQCDCLTPVEIIDDYVAEIEQETDLALGFMASYVGNLHVALGRPARERKAKGKTVITCGTLFDSATYVVGDGVSTLNLTEGAEQQDEMRRIQATMAVVACLYVDTMNYDHLFYLPALVTDGSEAVRQMDMNLQVAFKAFSLFPVTPLMAEGETLLEVTEKRCEEVLRVIYES